MNYIERVFNSSVGLQHVEQLNGTIFTLEGFAHTFVIHHYETDPDTGASEEVMFHNESLVTGRFIRGDGVNVFITGEVMSGVLYLALPPECYGAPGQIWLNIFCTVDNQTTCVYACTATDTESGDDEHAIIPDDTEQTLEEKVYEILGDAWVAGLFARNIGDIEGEIQTFHELVDGVYDALAAQDIRALNGPNLIKVQPEGVTVNVPSSAVIQQTLTVPVEDATAAASPLTFTVTDPAITSSYVLHGMGTTDANVVGYSMVTGVASAGSMTITIAARPGAHAAAVTVTVYICTVTSAVLPYGEISRTWAYNRPILDSSTNSKYIGDAGEEISECVVELTGTDIVTEEDGATYNRAVAFTVTNPPQQGMNNADVLVFNYGNSSYAISSGYNAANMGDIAEMEVGQKYTISCWVRVTSGTSARLMLVWGNTAQSSYASRGGRKYMDVSGTQWQRISWTFTFEPSGAQWNQYTSDGVTYNQALWQKKVGVGVCRAFAGTVQLCGFRLVRGGLMGDNTVDTLQQSVDRMMASIAPVESGPTAGAAYAQGALLVWGGRLYKASAAIAIGDAFTVGTNLTATTVAQELAALAAQIAGV